MPPTEPTEPFERAAALLADAEALLVCAGTGMGVDSGLPDFCGGAGFWRAYPPYERLGLRFEELDDPVHFSADPELAWGFYGHRLHLYRETTPHCGFEILRGWGAALPGGLRVFTSNVDGQFQRAGFTEEQVAECHGSIHHLQCVFPCSGRIRSAEGVRVAIDPETMRAHAPLPQCPDCDDLARPNILMFGDAHWAPDRGQAQLDALNDWRRGLRGKRLVVVEIGAGQAVPTVRPLRGAGQRGHRRADPDQPARTRGPARLRCVAAGQRPAHTDGAGRTPQFRASLTSASTARWSVPASTTVSKDSTRKFLLSTTTWSSATKAGR